MPSFLGRYGGDEFILIIHPAAREEIDRLIAEIRDEIGRSVGDAPYSLSVSVGYDELTEGRDSVQDCIRRADERLYQDKAQRRQNHL